MSETIDKVQVSIRLPADTYEAFGRIASALERDRTWVMLRAFSQYLENEGRNILQEAEGIASLDRGEGIDMDEVLDEVDEIIKRAEDKHAARRVG